MQQCWEIILSKATNLVVQHIFHQLVCDFDNHSQSGNQTTDFAASDFIEKKNKEAKTSPTYHPQNTT